MPDANNILQLSKLFGVTTDYLLNYDYQSDNDLPKVKEVQNDNLGQIMIYLVTLEVMVLLMKGSLKGSKATTTEISLDDDF